MNASPVFSSETWRSRAMAIALWSLVAVGFGGTGWVFGVRPIAVMIQNWRLAQDYREVPAKIVGRNVRAADGTADVVVAALYDVDGKPYYTERLTLVDDGARDEPENASFAMALRPLANTDARSTVWVDPDDPKTAVVSRFFNEEAILRRASLAIVFSVLALVGVVGALGALGNFGFYRRFDNNKRAWLITVPLCALIFPLRRLFIDADVDRYDDIFEIALFLEIGASLFLFVAISLLFERGAGKSDERGKQIVPMPTRPVRAPRGKTKKV